MKMAEPGLRQIGRNLESVEFSLWVGVAIWTELFGEGGRRFRNGNDWRSDLCGVRGKQQVPHRAFRPA